MNNKNPNINYFELFDQMGLEYCELPKSYNPDEYARFLIRNGVETGEISYAASTTIIECESKICKER